MKKIKTQIKNASVIVILLIAFTGCEREFTNLGTGIAGVNNFDTDKFEYPVITYNQNLGPVQSNNLTSYLFGHHDDPIYGSTTANFVAQVTASSYSPVFGENVELDSVVLTIPYYSRITGANEDGSSAYVIDSLYGSDIIKLSIYRNNFFLRDFDPNSELNTSQIYYSNGSTDEMNLINPSDLEGELLYEDLAFVPSDEEIVLTQENSSNDPDEVNENTTLAPSLRAMLYDVDKPEDANKLQFWHDLLFNQEGEDVLSNQNNFLNYFRGLYFKAEAIGGAGNMSLLNIISSNTSFVIYYKNGFDTNDDDNDTIPNFADADIDGDGTLDNGIDTDGDGISDVFDVNTTGGTDANSDGIDDDIVPDQKTFDLNLTGNIVNIINNNGTLNIPVPNEIDGDEKLYLKGTHQSMAVINLFEGDENGESDWLTDFKSNNWLINEANLVFYVDQDMLLNHDEPERLYLYDIDNNAPLVDFFLDQTGIETGINIKGSHAVPLIRENDEDPDSQGVKYKFRITEHLNNILLRDSTNVKLGLTVGSNLLAADNIRLQNQDGAATQIAMGSFLTPRSTVLYGNNTTDTDKKVWLEIYYTEPDQQ